MYLTILEWLGQHLPVPLQYSRLVGKLVKLRDVVRSHIGPANDLRSGTEVLVKKVFHLPSPCAIFYQLRLIALFVNVMNLYNNGLIMTMIMLIMVSLIMAIPMQYRAISLNCAGIAPGKSFFLCQTLSITLSAVSPVSLSTAVYSETLPVVRKTVRGVSIISPKVPPYSLQIVITNLPNIPELKGPQYCNIAMYLFLAAQAAS